MLGSPTKAQATASHLRVSGRSLFKEGNMLDYDRLVKLGPVDRWKLLLRDLWPSLAVVAVLTGIALAPGIALALF